MGTNQKHHILILDDDAYFRNQLVSSCPEVAQIESVGDVESALGLMAHHSFDLILMDWHLIQTDLSSFYSTLENFQANAVFMALFTVPDLANVITAMKSGARDIIWAAQDSATMRAKIVEALSIPRTKAIAHSFVSKLAESLTEKAITQKTTLFKARREFSKTFLHQILTQQNLRRTQLASLMSVSPRTLHRHLSA
jgi:DNA-binding NtrC family response regulator